MTVQHAVKVFDQTGFETGTQKLVLLELAYRADRKGIVRYSQSEIAESTALARRTVANQFAFFETVGLIERLGHGRYQLNADLLDAPRIFEPLLKLQPGYQEELDRLKDIRKPNQYIAFTKEGWPVLQDDVVSDY